MPDPRSADPKRAQDELLLLLAHELRNPVHALTTALDVFDASPAGSATAQEARDVLRRQGARLTHLLDDLLAVARVLTGRAPLHRSPCDLAAMATALVAARPRATMQSAPAKAAIVTADSRWLQHALAAILDKALQQWPDGVLVQVTAAQGQATLVIEDASAPMRSAMPAEAPQELQLLVARHLLELHGGTLPNPPGEPCWRVVLPLAANHDERLPGVTPRAAAVPE